MQQFVTLLWINCSSTYFGRLYAHHQEVRLRFHCIWLSVLLWLYSTQCIQLASRLSNITIVTTGQINSCSENAVWPPEDGRKDARNMLRNNWLTIKSQIVASSWSHIYLHSIQSSLLPSKIQGIPLELILLRMSIFLFHTINKFQCCSLRPCLSYSRQLDHQAAVRLKQNSNQSTIQGVS